MWKKLEPTSPIVMRTRKAMQPRFVRNSGRFVSAADEAPLIALLLSETAEVEGFDAAVVGTICAFATWP
jgi:hypothetical protein